jgi:hypothetical protein
MKFGPDCCNEMANRPALLLVALSRQVGKGWDCRVYLRTTAAFARGEASDQQRP